MSIIERFSTLENEFTDDEIGMARAMVSILLYAAASDKATLLESALVVGKRRGMVEERISYIYEVVLKTLGN